MVGYLRLGLVLTITVLPRLNTLEQTRQICKVYPNASEFKQIRSKYRNINLFPFRLVRLRQALGPTNPRLMNIVEETWPFRW
jgi:hypothetical protein